MTRTIAFIVLAVALVIPACRQQPTAQPASAPATRPTTRIVSFSPSISSMLYDMGLGEQVVGVTTQCHVPDGYHPAIVGDALSVNAEAILAAHPDIILTQVDPARFAAVASADPKVQIVYLSIETLPDIPAAARKIAVLAGVPKAGAKAAATFIAALDDVQKRVAGLKPTPAIVLWGGRRSSTGGSGTFIDDMITAAGGYDVAADRFHGWVNIDAETVVALAPEVLIVQADPAEAAETRSFWRSLADLPAARNGAIFIVTDPNWTVPSLHSPAYVELMASMLHPPETPQ